MDRKELEEMIRELLKEMSAELGGLAARAIDDRRRAEGKPALEL